MTTQVFTPQSLIKQLAWDPDPKSRQYLVEQLALARLSGYLPLPGGGVAESSAGIRHWIKTGVWRHLDLPQDVYSGGDILEASGVKPSPAHDYKDLVDNVFSENHTSPEKACGHYAVRGKCANDHVFARELLCGREWCPRCGSEWSAIHQQRFARLLPKAQQMESIGYWVLEFPLSSRDKYRTQDTLRAFGKRVKAAFKLFGYDRGLRRWHWFGDVCIHTRAEGLICEYSGKKCPKRKCDKFVNNGRYNPHLNILVDGGYIKLKALETVQGFLRLVLDEPELIINYSYCKSPAKKVHTLKYVTRSTFLDKSWDSRLAEEMLNFRNTTYWGKWHADPDLPPVWSLDDLPGESKKEVAGLDVKSVESLLSGSCPCCGLELNWTRKEDVADREYALLLKVRKRALKQAEMDEGNPYANKLRKIRGQPPEMSVNDMIKLCRGLEMHNSIKNDLRDILRNPNVTESDIVPMASVKKKGVPLGAGYWRLCDLDHNKKTFDPRTGEIIDSPESELGTGVAGGVNPEIVF